MPIRYILALATLQHVAAEKISYLHQAKTELLLKSSADSSGTFSLRFDLLKHHYLLLFNIHIKKFRLHDVWFITFISPR
jgi:hypothetical protein